jgi:hypothetical protein
MRQAQLSRPFAGGRGVMMPVIPHIDHREQTMHK